VDSFGYLIPKFRAFSDSDTEVRCPSTWRFRVRQPGALCPPTWSLACPSTQKMVTRTDLISELYGEGEATLLYDLHAPIPGKTQRTAEHFRLAGGKIASILLIFDASPWRPD
jgi:hypothetical protein